MENLKISILYKILLVEDNLFDVDLINEYLTMNSDFIFEFIHVDSLNDAFKTIETNSIDIILLDLMLGESRGIETFEKLYAKHSEVPIIVLSGLSDKNISIECVKGGAQNFLIKGEFNQKILSRSICYAIERKNLEKAVQNMNNSLEIEVKERAKEIDEINITLKTVLKNIDDEKNKTLENIALNIEKNIMPLITNLKSDGKSNKNVLKLLEENINMINSGFHRRLINFKYGLTPTEIKVCKLVKAGYLAKEIADILHVASTTVNEHKSNIRKKLGITDSSINLKIFLDELSPD